MEQQSKSTILATGFAIFSMFFGAGNVVFPLAIGQHAQDLNIYAILGLLITAVGVPLLGMLGMTLYKGDYTTFFNRIGKVPGFFIAFLIMGLIGPFGAIPRCIALSFSTAKVFFPNLSLIAFSIVSCLLIFAFTVKQNKIVDVLGYVLTPFLLGSLIIIIVKGVWTSPPLLESPHDRLDIFLLGLREGYQTMDLLGAFFFSSVVLVCLKNGMSSESMNDYKQLISTTLKASVIAAVLLAGIYLGFSFLAAFQSPELHGLGKDMLLARIALNVLGPYAGIVACAAVALACITTAIALSAVSAEFIQSDVTMRKLGYVPCLIITLIITFFISTLNFSGIVNMLAPILEVLYPSLIVLTIANIAHKLWNFPYVKIPFFGTLALSLIAYFAP